MIPQAGKALKVSDALLDHISKQRDIICLQQWQLAWVQLLLQQMAEAPAREHTRFIREIAEVLDGPK